MKIDGKTLAENILNGLSRQVRELKVKGVVPTLAVILVGDDPASISYVHQKRKAAEQIGAKLILSHQSSDVSRQTLQSTIQQFNNDQSVHGLIVQRPLPKELGDVGKILSSVNPQKDIDGFVPGSPFEPPIAVAVISILKEVCQDKKTFWNWLARKNIVVIGRGETGGKLIASSLQSHHFATSIIHSQTPDPQAIIRKADIIISCVGKERVVKKEALKPEAILIGVGIWRDNQGKLHGDYEEEEIKDIAGFYTPTPGGVGPVNVACLMENLLAAASEGNIDPCLLT